MLPLLSASLRSTSAAAQARRDPLPSWNDGATKASILDLVARVTAPGGPDFVPPEQRIATFDNDGTLWIEQPIYIQLASSRRCPLHALMRSPVRARACSTSTSKQDAPSARLTRNPAVA